MEILISLSHTQIPIHGLRLTMLLEQEDKSSVLVSSTVISTKLSATIIARSLIPSAAL